MAGIAQTGNFRRAEGSGAASGGGIRAARGRFIIMGDADDSFLSVPKFVGHWRRFAIMVMGNRFRAGIKAG